MCAGNTGIDATSERLLQDDTLSNQTIESYKKLSSVDEERLIIISKLRAHITLLVRYFALLNELATSDTPERAQKAIDGVADGLNALGKELRGSPLLPNKEAVSGGTQLAIGFMIRGALKHELNKHKDMMMIELKTQEQLLQVLSKSIEQDLTISKEAREYRQVLEPLKDTKPISNKAEWIANRREVLTAEIKIAELSKASETAGKLKEAFEDLVADKLSMERLNTLLIDLDAFLAIAEAGNK